MLRLVTVVTLALATPSAYTADCPSNAENAIDSLHTWADVHAAFTRFAPQCDDGGVAEGFSDRIVHLLASNWAALPALYKIMEKDAGFGPFVLKHIDATTDSDELDAIAKMSVSTCPGGRSALCAAIHRAALGAIAEGDRLTMEHKN